MKVLIAGAGIGGLTVALCCLHFGHDVTLFEKADMLGEVGAGLQIPPNAMKVFEALGLSTQISQNAFKPEAIEARMGESGRSLFRVFLTEAALKRWGAPYLHIHRADYIEALRSALLQRSPRSLQLDAEIAGFSQDEDGATLHLADGRTFSGDVIVGCDGIHSTIRTQMLGPDRPVFTGNVAWRAVVPIEVLGSHAPQPTACVWMGRGKHAVTYRLRQGALANFVGVVEQDDWSEEGWSIPGSRQAARADFADWHPTITSILEHCDDAALFRWALFDRAPLERWTDGRVSLLGDAAHPMLPFLAQGAAMAVEDGWVLARELAVPDRSVNIALKAYEQIRRDRTAKVQNKSRANMKTFHQRSLPGQIMTYGPMWLAGNFAPQAVRRRLDWLYAHDVV